MVPLKLEQADEPQLTTYNTSKAPTHLQTVEECVCCLGDATAAAHSTAQTLLGGLHTDQQRMHISIANMR